MRLLDAIRAQPAATEQRFDPMSISEFIYNGNSYMVGPSGSSADKVSGSFRSYVQQIHQRHGVVAAAVVTRGLLMSQVRFRWRDEMDGTLSTSRELQALNRPGSMSRTRMLSLLEIDASYSGSGFLVRRNGVTFRLEPDEVHFVLGSDSDPSWEYDTLVAPYDTRVVGLLHKPGSAGNGSNVGPAELFGPGEFAVWAPEPDPLAPWRGSSWVTSVVRETLLDGQATEHMGKFFEKAATPGLVFMMDPSKTPEQTSEYAKIVNEKFGGNNNAYRNMFLGGGTDVKVVGSAVKDLGLGELQGTFENRVAVRSRIPSSVLGIKESLSGSSLNSGNYSAARRLLADSWFSPTVDGLCEALEPLLSVPAGMELGHDPGRILFLQEDAADAAAINQTDASSMRQLIDGGFDPQSVIDAVTSGDLTKLTHTGNMSVQLQPPGMGDDADAESEESKSIDRFRRAVTDAPMS